MTGKPRPFRRLPQTCHEHGAPAVPGPELSSSPYGLLATTIVRRMSPRRTASIMLRRRPTS